MFLKIYGNFQRWRIQQSWNRILFKVFTRERSVNRVSKTMPGSPDASKEIATTDIFVEKAQETLESRARNMVILAVMSAILAGLLVKLLFDFYDGDKSFFAIDLTDPKVATQKLISGVIKNATFFGIFFGIEYLLISLFRAFLHEATTLNNRVHSLRLGRLFVYLKYASAKSEEMPTIRDSITASELERAFGWNIETSTAFKDIDAGLVTKSIWSNISDIAVSVLAKK